MLSFSASLSPVVPIVFAASKLGRQCSTRKSKEGWRERVARGSAEAVLSGHGGVATS